MKPTSFPPFRIRRALAVFVLLFLFAIPWWCQFTPSFSSRIVLGAPAWFVTSILGSIIISAVCARYMVIAWRSLETEQDSRSEDQTHE